MSIWESINGITKVHKYTHTRTHTQINISYSITAGNNLGFTLHPETHDIINKLKGQSCILVTLRSSSS